MHCRINYNESISALLDVLSFDIYRLEKRAQFFSCYKSEMSARTVCRLKTQSRSLDDETIKEQTNINQDKPISRVLRAKAEIVFSMQSTIRKLDKRSLNNND